MATAYIIGNGPSRRELHLSELEGTTFGCNALYRDFSPDYLLSGDATIIKEICRTGYPKNKKCIFPDWDPIPKEFKDTILQPFKEQDYRIEESDIDKYEHIQIFGLSEDPSEDLQIHVLGVDPDWQITNMKGTEDDPGFSVNFFCGSNAMAQASIMGFDKIRLIGFDSVWNFIPDTYQNIYAGTNAYDNAKETARLRVGSNNPNSLMGTQEAQIKKVLDRTPNIEYTIYYSGNKNPKGDALWAPLTYDSFK
jgi:hypothetical protein